MMRYQLYARSCQVLQIASCELAINTVTIMGIQDKHTNNSIKSKIYAKSKTLSELEKGPVKLMQRVKIVHSFFVSNQFHVIILSLHVQ